MGEVTMTKSLITLLALLLAYSPVSAQQVEMVFGPLDGDNAGILYADTSQAIEVDLWMRTSPGISIVVFHIPLSSKDQYIRSDSREGGEYCELLHTWDDVTFLSPNPDPMHGGYTNQSFLGIEFIEPDCDNGIITEGEWWWIASFRMTTVGDAPTAIPLCDALIEGYHPDQEGNILADCYIGEIDPSDISLDFACLWINEVACSEYTVGDYNGSGAINVADIVDSYSKLKTGLPEPASICECPPESGDFWAVAADVNNSCAFNVADVVDGYSFLKTGSPEPEPCWMCPPGEP
jgi:hypothetical protein